MSSILLFITVVLVAFLILNLYVIHLQKKQHSIKAEMISEDKVKQYITYLSTIIDKKEEEIKDLYRLKAEDPEDKSIDILISKKQQEKSAVREEMTNFVSENEDNQLALKTERSFLISENEQLKAKIDHLGEMGKIMGNSDGYEDLRKKYEEIRIKYQKLQQEYEITKKTLDQLDEQFTKLYHEE